MPEVTHTESQPPLPEEEATKPDVEALPADGERVMFTEEGNTQGWMSFDPSGTPDFSQR